MKRLGPLLLAAGIAGLSLTPAGGAGDAAHDPDDVAVLRAQYAYFQNLPASRQQELHKLDADFHALDREAQDRLRRVLDRYNYWLAHLPEAERRRVADAPPDRRLKVIVDLKEREWVETLPKAYRDRYAKATPAERIRLAELWHEEQRERQAEWSFVRHNWEDLQNNRIPPLFQGATFKKDVDAFVANLETQVPPHDRDRLRKFRDQPPEEREWYKYIRTVLDLSDKHPLLPGPAYPPDKGPRTFETLPKPVQDAIDKAGTGMLRKRLAKEFQSVQGRWPEYAIGVTEFARLHHVALPEQLGPSHKAEMPPDVQTAIDKLAELLKRAAAERGEKAEQAQKDVAKLKDAEGKWPDYPRTLMELAKQYRQPIPEWTLPRAEVWERFRANKPARKLQP
jgi:hypothetical protein